MLDFCSMCVHNVERGQSADKTSAQGHWEITKSAFTKYRLVTRTTNIWLLTTIILMQTINVKC